MPRAVKAAPAARSALAGIALTIAATACFAWLDAASKVLAATLPMAMVVWLRYLVQALSTSLVLLPRGGWAAVRTGHLRAQCLRGLLLVASSALAFFSVRWLPLAEFTAIVMVTPLVVTLVAATLLGERVSPLRWLAVGGGFAGVLLVLRPGGAAFGWAAVLPLALVAVGTWFQALTSRLAKTDRPMVMQFYGGWVGTAATLPLVAWQWAAPPEAWMWAVLGFIGMAGTVGHYLLAKAYVRAQASTLMPFLYAQIGFALLAGWVLFGHVPDAVSLAGMGLVGACGALGAMLSVRESRRG